MSLVNQPEEAIFRHFSPERELGLLKGEKTTDSFHLPKSQNKFREK